MYFVSIHWALLKLYVESINVPLDAYAAVTIVGKRFLAHTANVPPYPEPHKITDENSLLPRYSRMNLINDEISPNDCSTVRSSKFAKDVSLKKIKCNQMICLVLVV